MDNFEEKFDEGLNNTETPAETPGQVADTAPVEPPVEAPVEVPNQEPNQPEVAPVFNRINYTQKPINDYKPFGKGLKIFCAALAAVILLTAACAGGYFLGKSGNLPGTNLYKKDVKVDLAAKPKNQDGMTAAEVYEAVNPSIVGIRLFNSTSAIDASGVIYSKDGYIITNDHIYESVGAPKFKIYTYDGKEYDAEYVAGDTISDLSVLKIKNGSDFKAAEFGNSDELVCGEAVYSIGRPGDAADKTSITAGTVSLASRRVKSATSYSSKLIQTDSAINPGSSGGALCNMYGQVVGITVSKKSGDDYDSMNFSIPTTTVKRIVEQLISSGKVTDRAKLGITYNEINSVVKETNNYSAVGLYIQSVSSDSSLYGKAKEGDIITHINGIKITKDSVVLDIIDESKPGDEVTLTVLSSSGAQQDYKVKLGANVGESSYSKEETKKNNSSDNNSSSNGGTFNFPFGDQ